MNLTKIHSITKKITVALLGGFLLLFILFHACANLLILRNDDGAWYSAFCHFMGTNYIVKVFEVILLLTVIGHICVTLWLVYTNYKARGTVRYHHRSRTKTHSGSKLMAWTGALILCLLVVHFFHFYFVKLDIVPGTYMVETEEFSDALRQNEEIGETFQMAQIYRVSPKEIATNDSSKAALLPIFEIVENESKFSDDHKWIKEITRDERDALRAVLPDLDIEPDFYTMTRAEFKNLFMVIIYLVFFVVLFIHMRHAFPSVFQTLGLNNYKYNKALDICGLLYAIIVCLMFTITVLGIYIPSIL